MMYLARILIGSNPVVHEVNDYEYLLPKNDADSLKRVPRGSYAWPISFRGRVGAAAFDTSRRNAIVAAKLMLEKMEMEREDEVARARRQQRIEAA